MKKLLFVLLFVLGPIFGFTQNRFHYIIKIEGVTPINKNAVVWLNGMFETYPTFNDSTSCFDFFSNFNIEKSLFEMKAYDRQYNVLYFSKAGILIAKLKEEEDEK